MSIGIEGQVTWTYNVASLLTGYQLLGGSNSTVGDLSYEAYMYDNGSEVVYSVKLQWNDIMNPNYSHLEDTIATYIVAPGIDYTVRINWTYEFTLYK